jgi:hypothetical protein
MPLVVIKSKRTLEYLSCDIPTYRAYLEAKFKPDMTWDNYGTLWHIDHIIPITYGAPTIEEVAARLHYTNTQPMYASDNIAKGNRYIG